MPIFRTKTCLEPAVTDLLFDYPPDQPLMITTRRFNAPRALVWACFTRPEHIMRWWGPKSLSPITRIEQHDFRPGGKWRYVCTRPDGSAQIVFFGTFLEIVLHERIVNTFAVEGMADEDPDLTETHSFAEESGQTLYRAVSNLGSITARDAVVASGMEHGARESIAQLDELLALLRATAST